MANLIFPPAPTTGQEFIGTFGEIYTWDGEKWTLTSAGPVVPTPPPAAVGPTPPASPASGDLWWDTISGQLFIWYIDANSAQWVVANVSVGVPGPEGPAGPNVMPPGVTDGSNAAAGQVGEVISNTVALVSTGSNNWLDVVTLNVTPGDWEIIGYVNSMGISFSNITSPPADGAVMFALRVNNTWSPGSGYMGGQAALTFQPGGGMYNNAVASVVAGPFRLNTAVAATVTLSVAAIIMRSLTGATCEYSANTIWARRMR